MRPSDLSRQVILDESGLQAYDPLCVTDFGRASAHRGRGVVDSGRAGGGTPSEHILLILGISALLQPLPVTERILAFDQWIMLGVSIVLFYFLCTGRRVSRLEGGLLLLGYVLYLGVSFTVLAV